MRYEVTIPEVWYRQWEVEAESEKEAIQKALDGDGDEGDFEYAFTMDSSSAYALHREEL
jgi:hypothetical protein